MLKGKNQRYFRHKLQNHILNSLTNIKDLEIKLFHDHGEIKNFDPDSKELIINKLKRIPGLHSYSIAKVIENSDKAIIAYFNDCIVNQVINNNQTYKIKAKRNDKTLPYSSLEFTQKVAKLLSTNFPRLLLDLRNYNATINFIILNSNNLLVYASKELLFGGLPANSQSFALGLISGGLDSPIASILTIKKGVQLELIHFESSPMTPLESIDKVFSLVKNIATFTPKQHIVLHVVPLFEIHQAILKYVSDPYIITILRRMMYRIADGICNKYNISTIVSGDSVGQVASQTLESLSVVGSVTNKTILRPLASYDKEEIINLTKKYDFYDTAILPFEDCCTVYLPHNPTTKPNIFKAEYWESKFDYRELINQAIEKTIDIIVDLSFDFKFAEHGLDFTSSYKEYIRARNLKQGK